MKVTHNTPETLIIDHVPWLMSIGLALLILLFVGIGLIPFSADFGPMRWLFAFMFIFVGGGLWLMALELFARRLQFVFDRPSNRITIRRRSIFTNKTVSHKLSRLKEARIQQSFSENGQALSRPVLTLHSTRKGRPTEKTVALHHYYTSGSGPEEMAAMINEWWAENE